MEDDFGDFFFDTFNNTGETDPFGSTSFSDPLAFVAAQSNDDPTVWCFSLFSLFSSASA